MHRETRDELQGRTTARARARGWLALVVVLCGGATGACSDVGDSSAVPAGPGGGDDSTAPEAQTGTPDPGIDGMSADSPVTEAGSSDASTPYADSTVAEAGRESSADSTVVETGPVSTSADGGALDAGAPDTGALDTGRADSAGGDAGPANTGVADARPGDSSTEDAGSDSASDSAVADTGAPDAGRDTGGPDASNSVSACVTAPCAATGADSARCSGSPGGVCTPTEAIVMNYDIAHSGQGPGAPLPGGCYMCLVANACIDADGTTNGLGIPVTNAECGDPNGMGENPPFDSLNGSSTSVPACLDALTCVLTGDEGALPHCTTALSPFTTGNCFCGANRGAACIASPSSPTGVCASSEFTDLGTTDPTTATGHFTDPTNPGGVGNAIMNCAVTALSGGTTPPIDCGSCFL
jgi:hypothetical protein